MKRRRFWMLWGLLLGAVVGLALTWLTPFATSGAGYCWLVLGKNREARLLLHRTGEEWFLDRDGDGRFHGNGERLGIPAPGARVALTNLDGVAYTLVHPRAYHDESLGDRCLVEAEIGGKQPFRQLADIGLGRSRWTAGMSHFNGPLTVQAQSMAWQLPPGLALRRGEKPTDVRVLIGTLDAGTRCWTTVWVMGTNGQSLFPTNVYPFVDVEFPAKGAGAERLHVRYPLKEFC